MRTRAATSPASWPPRSARAASSASSAAARTSRRSCGSSTRYKTGAKSVNPDIRVLLDLQRVLHRPEQGRLRRRSSSSVRAPTSSSAPAARPAPAASQAAAAGRQVGHRRRPGRVLHHLQRWRRPRVGVPRHLGRSSASTSPCSATSSRRSTARSRAASTRLEAANDGITYAPFHDADIPDDVADEARGDPQPAWPTARIDTGVDPVTGLPN